MDNTQQNFSGGAMPLRPSVASSEGRPRPVPPRPTPPPPPPLPRDFEHVAPITPQKPAAIPIPPTELKTPPPSGPEVRIRSLQSDAETLAASGGAAPQAQTIRLEELEDETPVFSPTTVDNLPEGVMGGSPRRRLLIMAGASVAGVIALGLAAYYLIYPLLSPTTPGIQPAIAEPTPVDAIPHMLPHVSLFATPLPSQAQLDLPAVTIDAIRAAVEREVITHPAPHVMDELAVFTNGSQVPFADFINALIPELSAATVKNLIADDFSGFVYFDNSGYWPGYVTMLRPEAIPGEVQQTFAQMESANLAALYVNDPGVKGEFKSGQVNGAPTRYSIFGNPGASFNYGIFGNYLVISTSFDGLKAILPFLGL